MTVLADSSVWIGHWRNSDPAFAAQVEAGEVSVHPFVIGELALGSIGRNDEALRDLRLLPVNTTADHVEVLALVQRHRLWGTGIGWVDAHLIASALIDETDLWTLDQALARAAASAGVHVVT